MHTMKAPSKRESQSELQIRMQAANHLVPKGIIIRHVRTGGEYIVAGHSLRVGDLAGMVQYRPLTGPVVEFSREAKSIQAKFVRTDGEDWSDIKSFQAN